MLKLVGSRNNFGCDDAFPLLQHHMQQILRRDFILPRNIRVNGARFAINFQPTQLMKDFSARLFAKRRSQIAAQLAQLAPQSGFAGVLFLQRITRT